MIPDLLSSATSRTVRRRWIFFLSLAPLAMAAGLWLDSQRPSGLDGLHVVGRSQAIAAAREYARSLGVDVSGWSESCAMDTSNPRVAYVSARKNEASRLIQELDPWSVTNVAFKAPDGRSIRIRMNIEGRMLGFQLNPPAQPDPAPEAESRAAATAIVEADPVFAKRLITGKPTVEVQRIQKTGAEIRVYTWHGTLKDNHDIDFQSVVKMQGRTVIGRNYKADLNANVLSAVQHETGADVAQWMGIAYVIFLIPVVIYALQRYVRRSIEKEIPHRRTVVVTLITAVILGLQIFNLRDQINVQVAGEKVDGPLALIAVIMIGIFVVLGGALAGLAYGAGEGDVREGYPGKLTSLDALIVGKVFSANVGRSLLAGAGIAGWLYLVQQTAQWFLPPMYFRDLGSLAVLTFRLPVLVFLAGQPMNAILATVSGLFQPLAFARLNLRKPGVRWTFLILCAAFGSLMGQGRSPAEALVAMVVGAALILGSFLMMDVLTTMSAMVALHSLSMLSMFSRLSLEWRETADVIVVLGLLTIVAAALAARYGKRYHEDEVRPMYASQIAERMSLEAEVSAAREAQLRLLPHALPEIPGINIAASCIPAQEVGGDFFDFFRLGPHRLGVFVAEGSGQGLASAMTIALAKGYLMHAVTKSQSPAEILTRLERALGNLLHSQLVRASVAFVVIDSVTGRLHYARTGDYPRVLVSFRGRVVPPLLEAVISTADRTVPLVEGEIDLEAGFSVVVYTDGIVKRLVRLSKLSPSEYMAQLDQDARRPAEALHSALFAKLLPRGKRSREDLEDDLTAVVIRLAQRESESIGVVA